MTAYQQRYSGARDFCESQHSLGLAVWDTEEKYLDLKFIVGREGRDKEAFTALYNEGAPAVCNKALECDGNLVKKMYWVVRVVLHYILLSLKWELHHERNGA